MKTNWLRAALSEHKHCEVTFGLVSSFYCRKPAVSGCSKQRTPNPPLFDHIVGTLLEEQRHVETKRLSCLEIDHKLVLGRRLHGQISGLLPLEDAVDVRSHLSVNMDTVRAIRH